MKFARLFAGVWIVAGAAALVPAAAAQEKGGEPRPKRLPGAPPILNERDRDAPVWVTPPLKTPAPRVRHETFDSATVKTKVSYFVYTPPEYDTQKERRFPVLYYLHAADSAGKGVPDLAGRFDAAIRAGDVPPLLVVWPNGLEYSYWIDSKDGKRPLETILVKELLPHIDGAYRTVAGREGRMVEGFSMGAYGAARLGFKYDTLFGAVSILGAGPYLGDPAFMKGKPILRTAWGGDFEYYKAQSPWVLAEKNAAALRGGTRIRELVGDRDVTDAHLDEHLTRLEIPHTFTKLPGVGHSAAKIFDALGEKNWEFYRLAFGAKAKEPEKK
jgi:enterochelin esterase-like enzyme